MKPHLTAGRRAGFRLLPALSFFCLLCGLFLNGAGQADAAMGLPGNLPEKPGKNARSLRAVLDRLAGQGAEVVRMQRELVCRPALSPISGGLGEDDKARWIEDWLRGRSLPSAERLDSPDSRVPSRVRPNLILHYPGSSGRTLWIIGHLDVSPPGPENLWTSSPWALRVDGDRLYGRGVEDNHQSIVAGLLLYEALVKEKVTPPLGLGLLYTAAGKEYPREHGLSYVLQSRPGLIKPLDLVVVNDYGNSRGSVIEVAEKGLLLFKITVSGRQAHAAFAHEGLNALEAGAAFIVGLPALRESFPKTNPLFTPEVSTFSATAPEGGDSAANQIPGQFVFHLDCRFLPGYSVAEVEETVRALAGTVEKKYGVSIQVAPVISFSAVSTDNLAAPVIAALERAVRDELKTETRLVGIGAPTMATDLREKGITTAVWANATSQGAATDESIGIAGLLKSAAVFARLLYYSELDLQEGQ